jgi:hypothetical protein
MEAAEAFVRRLGTLAQGVEPGEERDALEAAVHAMWRAQPAVQGPTR